MNIYVGNLPYSVRDEELRSTFEPFGAVVSAEVIFDKRTRRSRGYGFVEMASDADALKAIAALNGSPLHGRELRVDASQPKSEKVPARDGAAASPRARREGPVPTPAPAGGLRGFLKRLFG